LAEALEEEKWEREREREVVLEVEQGIWCSRAGWDGGGRATLQGAVLPRGARAARPILGRLRSVAALGEVVTWGGAGGGGAGWRGACGSAVLEELQPSEAPSLLPFLLSTPHPI
jgi:hypothetical protein